MDGRENDYKWAGPYMVSRQVVAVNENSNIKKLSDLSGKVIAVQASTKPEDIFLNRMNPAIPLVKDVYSLENRKLLFTSLGKGYVDAIAGHENAMEVFVQSNEEHFGVLREELSVSELGIAFSFDNDSGIDKKLTGVLNEMRADGTIQSIAEKYGVDVSMAVWGN